MHADSPSLPLPVLLVLIVLQGHQNDPLKTLNVEELDYQPVSWLVKGGKICVEGSVGGEMENVVIKGINVRHGRVYCVLARIWVVSLAGRLCLPVVRHGGALASARRADGRHGTPFTTVVPQDPQPLQSSLRGFAYNHRPILPPSSVTQPSVSHLFEGCVRRPSCAG